MLKIHKNIIAFLVFFILLSASSFAYALEAKYPAIIGLPRITNDSKMPDLIRYFFGLGMYISAILAVISLTVGAIQTIMSATSPEAQKEGKDRMKSSILGLVLTLAAFLIMKTINFSLVQPSLSPLPGVAGIYYTNGLERKPAQMQDNTVNVPAGFGTIEYKCKIEGGGTGPTLLVWKFPKLNFTDDPNYPNTSVERLSCDGQTALPAAGSFKWTFETPGIYYFLKDGCKGLMSGANLTTSEISEPFRGKVKSVRIVNDAATDNYLGVIFHSDPDPSKGSDCTYPITSSGDNCFNLSSNPFSYPYANFSAFSADIFVYRRNDLSGDGVWFYSNVNGWDAGVQSGVSRVNAEEVGNSLTKEAEYFTFDYTGVVSPTADICKDFPSCRDESITDEEMADPTFMCCLCDSPKDWNSKNKDCGGSIRFGGNSYLVTLYTDYKDKDKKQRLFCQSFKKDAPNLSTESFLPSASAELTNISIIPIKW